LGGKDDTAGEDLLPLHAWSVSAKLRALRCTPISVCADRVLVCRVTFRGGLTDHYRYPRRVLDQIAIREEAPTAKRNTIMAAGFAVGSSRLPATMLWVLHRTQTGRHH
jgi:hypothetical protein